MRIKKFYLLIVIILSGCTAENLNIEPSLLLETPIVMPSMLEENSPVENIPAEDIANKTLPDWCSPLEHATGTYTDKTFRNSHIIYLGSLWESEAFDEQIWKISWNDASEVMVHDNLPSPISGFAFLSDGYHYILGRRISDLEGSDWQEVQDRDKLSSDFIPYSPMWNMLSNSPEATDTYYGRGTLHSSTGLYSVEWEWENGRLILIDKKTEDRIEIIKEESLADGFSGGNWSPNGEYFAFTFYRNTIPYYSQVYLIQPKEDDILVPLTEPFEGVILGAPRWSPNGQKLAITFTGTNGRDHIAVINQVTKVVTEYPISPYIKKDSFQYQGEMVWSPDSRFFAYISQYEHYGVEILDTENGEIFCGRDDESMTINVIDWQ